MCRRMGQRERERQIEGWRETDRGGGRKTDRARRQVEREDGWRERGKERGEGQIKGAVDMGRDRQRGREGE